MTTKHSEPAVSAKLNKYQQKLYDEYQRGFRDGLHSEQVATAKAERDQEWRQKMELLKANTQLISVAGQGIQAIATALGNAHRGDV